MIKRSKLRVKEKLFIIYLKSIEGIGRSNFRWYSVPGLSAFVGYTILSEINSSMRDMKTIFTSAIKQGMNSRRN